MINLSLKRDQLSGHWRQALALAKNGELAETAQFRDFGEFFKLVGGLVSQGPGLQRGWNILKKLWRSSVYDNQTALMMAIRGGEKKA